MQLASLFSMFMEGAAPAGGGARAGLAGGATDGTHGQTHDPGELRLASSISQHAPTLAQTRAAHDRLRQQMKERMQVAHEARSIGEIVHSGIWWFGA